MIQCAHCALLYKSLSDEMGDRGADRIRVLNRKHVYREFHSLVLLTFLHTFVFHLDPLVVGKCEIQDSHCFLSCLIFPVFRCKRFLNQHTLKGPETAQ